MPRPASAQPTEVEMQILRILWELGPSPVREIHKRLEAAKGTNYSTTVKMLAVMLQKGLVKRDEEAQPHVYRPAHQPGQDRQADTRRPDREGLRRLGHEPGVAGPFIRKGHEGGVARSPPDARQDGGQIAMLEFLTQSTWADRIGWVLVHSLWQFALVALLAAVLQWALKRRSATTRYCALLAVMLVMAAVPVVTWFSPWSVDVPLVAAKVGPLENPAKGLPLDTTGSASAVLPMDFQLPNKSLPSTGEASGTPSRPLVASQRWQPTPRGLAAWLSLVQGRVQAWLPEIVLLWLAGVLLAACRPLLSWYTTHRLRTMGVSPVGDTVHSVLTRTAKRLRLKPEWLRCCNQRWLRRPWS